MSHSLFEIYIHIIFGTWRSFNDIPEEALPFLHKYIFAIFAKRKCHDICVGGMSDHVHILTSLPRDITVSEIVKVTKGATNKVLNEKFNLFKFSWQEGYAAFSVAPLQRDRVKNYILNQKKHHSSMSYDDEIKKLSLLCNYLGHP